METQQFYLKNRNQYLENYDIKSDNIKMIGSYFWEKNPQQVEVYNYNDMSKLKKFRELPPKGTNLLQGIDSFSQIENESSLNPIYKSLNLSNYDLRSNECQFITFRNNLNKIFATPYSKNGW